MRPTRIALFKRRERCQRQQILYDTTDKKSNITFRLWAGCVDGAKTTREYYMFQGKEIKLTPNDRRIADETIRQESFKDAIYKAGVEPFSLSL